MSANPEARRPHRPDRHEAVPGTGCVSGLHLGTAYAVNARGAIAGFRARGGSPGAVPTRPPADAREDPAGPAPSDLLAFLEREDPSPSSLAAAEAIRAMAGPAAASRRVDAAYGRWGFHDTRRLDRIGCARATIPGDAVGPLAGVMPWGAARVPAAEFLRGVMPPHAAGRTDAGRTGRLAESGPVPRDRDHLVAILSLPEAWTRNREADAAALAPLATAYAGLADLLGGYGFLSFARGRLAEARDRMDAGETGTASDRDAVDMADALDAQLVSPVLRRLGLIRPGSGHPGPGAASRRISARILFGAKGLPAILVASARWHASPLSGMPDLPNRSWPAPGPDRVAPNGLGLVWLTSSARLAAEGGRLSEGGLQHCVAGYAGKCLSGRSAIVSVRAGGGSGRRLSTAEILLADEGGARLIQHRSARNAEPGADERAAVAWLMDNLPAGSPAALAGSVPGAADELADLAESLDAWAPFLPRPIRSPAGFEAAVLAGADDLVGARVRHGWPGLRAGRLLPEGEVPWNAAAPPGRAIPTPARDAAELVDAIRAATGRLAPAGTPAHPLVALSVAAMGVAGGAALVLSCLKLSLDALATEGGATVAPHALALAAVSAVSFAAAVGVALLRSATVAVRHANASRMSGRILAARRLIAGDRVA